MNSNYNFCFRSMYKKDLKEVEVIIKVRILQIYSFMPKGFTKSYFILNLIYIMYELFFLLNIKSDKLT